MREIVALMRVSWLAAASYRTALVLSLVGFAFSFVPLFFIANALQPLAAESIAAESDRYFSFLLLGLSVLAVVTAAVSTLPGAIAGSIGSGTFEALLSTRVTMPRLAAGLSAYPLAWSLFKGLLMLAGAALIGIQIDWTGAPLALAILALTVICYFAVALVAASLILVVRTSGPLISGVLLASGLLGGVYYSTAAIPSWIQSLSGLVPLTYGLRAIRKVLLTGASAADIAPDLIRVSVFALVLLAFGSLTFQLALRQARRAGTLAQY